MDAYEIKREVAGLSASLSYTDIRDMRWLGVLATLALTSGAAAETSQAGFGPRIVYPDAVPLSNYSANVSIVPTDHLLIHELERVALLLAASDPQFDEATLKAIYDSPEQLYL